MDYDGNDNQGHNLKVAREAREGTSKSSSVLRPYAFPRFDIDDSLQGHIRFDSLVETDVFLGIQSQDDNQWIEDFSRGGDVIDFSSNATESCSIARQNNVWSEATSSESVEMLLKSVGQEQIQPKDTVSENSNTFNELRSLAKKMEPKFEQDSVNGGPTRISNASVIQNELLNNFSALENHVEGKLSQVEEISLSQEKLVQEHEPSSQMCPNDLEEECKLPVSEEVLLPGTGCDTKKIQGDECPADVCLDQTGDGLSHSAGPAQDINAGSSIPVPSQSPDQLSSHSEGANTSTRTTDDDVKEELASEEIVHAHMQILEHHKYEDAMHTEVSRSFTSSTESVDRKTDIEVIVNSNEYSMMSCAQECHFELLEGRGRGNSLTSPTLPGRGQTDILSTSRVISAASIGSNFTDNPEQHATKLCNPSAEKCSSSEAYVGAVEELDQKFSSDEVGNMTESSLKEGGQGNLVSGNYSQSSLIEGDNELSTDKISNANIVDLGESLVGPVSSSSVGLTKETVVAESVKDLHDASAVNMEGSRSSGYREEFQVEADQQSNATESKDMSAETKKKENISLSTLVIDVSPGTCVAPTSDLGSSTMMRNMSHDEPIVNQPHSENAGQMETEANATPCKNNDSTVECNNEDIHKQMAAVVGSACEAKSGIHHDSTTPLLSGIDGKLIPVIETCNVASGSKSPTLNSGDCSKRSEVHPDGNDSVLSRDPLKLECNSPTIISSVVLPPDESKRKADGGSEFAENKPSASEDPKGKDTSLDDNSFTFKVNLPPNAERDKANTWTPFPIAETYKSSVVLEGVTTPDTDKIHSRLAQETSGNNPGDCTHGISKATSGRKRRGSGKGVAKDNLQKGVNIKETTPDGSSHKEEKAFSVSLSPGSSLPGQFMVSQPHGLTKHKSKKLSTKNAVPTSNLPDLNASALKNHAVPTSALQPFTELQQVQLRAQIFVYGSLIQGTAPDEACMISAFGSSDRGRGVWEPVWQASVERVRSKKSQPGGESSMNSHSSGAKVPELACKQVSPEAKVFPSSVSRAGSKGTPTAILSPIMPLSSPLWSISTPYPNVSQSSNLQRRPVLHYQPAISPRQPYHTPPVQNIIGHTTRQSQAPASPSLWASQTSSLNVNARFSTTAITETVKLTPVKDFSLPAAPSFAKNVPSLPLVYTDTTSTVFARSSQLPDQIKGSLPSEVLPSADSKPRRRKKAQPSDNTPQNPLLSQAQTETIFASSLPTLTSPLTLVTSPTCHVITSMRDVISACSTSQPQVGNMDAGKASSCSEETLRKVEDARLSEVPPSADSKPRRRKKAQPSDNTPQKSLLSQGQTETVFASSLPTLTSPLTLVMSPTCHVTTSMRDIPACSTSQPQVGTLDAGKASCSEETLLKVEDARLAEETPAESKPRRRKKAQPSDNTPQKSLLSQAQTETVFASSVPTLTSPLTLVTSPTCHVTTSMRDISACSTSQPQVGNLDAGKASSCLEETLRKVEDARLQAEEAAAFAATSISHCQSLWSQLAKQDLRMPREAEVQIAAAAGAAAAAASVAKAAAAAARVASNAALQAKLMADEAVISTAVGDVGQTRNQVSIVHSVGNATSMPFITTDGGTNRSSSILVGAEEAVKRKLQAASAAAKQAENLDSILEAAKLAAEAVSQAGRVVAMGEPLLLKEIVSAGPEGYWKLPQASSELVIKSGDRNEEQINIGSAQVADISSKEYGGPPGGKISDHGRILMEEPSNDSFGNNSRSACGISEPIDVGDKDPGVGKSHKVSDVVQSNRGLSVHRNSSETENVQNQHELDTVHGSNIKEGSIVEVYKDGDGLKPAWFSANVLTLHDGKALVQFTSILSKEGSVNLKEWVALAGEGDKAPRLRAAPLTASHSQGTRKRRRSALGNYAWTVGDMVDVWIQDSWCEGIVTEKNEKDETTVTVHFPARGETSAVSTQQLRSSRIWTDGNWVLWSRLRGHDCSNESDTPLEKRPRLKSPFGKNKSEGAEPVVGKPEESKLQALSASDIVFNVGKSSKVETKPDARRTLKTGLHGEGSRMIFGVPKPGKKRKFVEVSKHFPAAQNGKNNESKDPVKFAKYLMPHGTASRGGKNLSKVDSKEKQTLRVTPLIPRSSSSRTVPQRDNLVNSASSPCDEAVPLSGLDVEKSVVHEEDTSKIALTDRGSSGTCEAGRGPLGGSFKKFSSSTKPNLLNKGKLAPAGGKLTKVDEEKVYNDNTDSEQADLSEPRRSSRKIQPTHRLLEGLQSSLIIPKMTSVPHEKGQGQKGRSTSALSRGK